MLVLVLVSLVVLVALAVLAVLAVWVQMAARVYTVHMVPEHLLLLHRPVLYCNH
jgi:hypothetical protein